MFLNAYKDKLRTFMLFAALTAMMFMFIFRVFVLGTPYLDYLHLPVISILLITIYVIWKRYNYYRPFDFLMVIYSFTIQIYLTYINGSYESPQIFWFYPFMMGFYLILGLRFSLAYYLYFNGVQFILYQLNPLAVELGSGTRGILFLVSSTIVAYFVYRQEQLTKSYRKIKKEYESNQTLNQIRGGLLHQINNPLSVVSIVAQKTNRPLDESMYKKLNDNVDRITKVMNELREIEGVSQLNSEQYGELGQILTVATDPSSKSDKDN